MLTDNFIFLSSLTSFFVRCLCHISGTLYNFSFYREKHVDILKCYTLVISCKCGEISTNSLFFRNTMICSGCMYQLHTYYYEYQNILCTVYSAADKLKFLCALRRKPPFEFVNYTIFIPFVTFVCGKFQSLLYYLYNTYLKIFVCIQFCFYVFCLINFSLFALCPIPRHVFWQSPHSNLYKSLSGFLLSCY